MTEPLVIAVPSKGRLQENATAFFARAGLAFQQSRGARDYHGVIPGLPGVAVKFLSASEITTQLATGQAHLGVTGEDLVREQIADADTSVALLTPLGFGQANVVVAAPQAWIDVRTMSDLDEVAVDLRVRRAAKMRVADQVRDADAPFLSPRTALRRPTASSNRSAAPTEARRRPGPGRSWWTSNHHRLRTLAAKSAEGARRRCHPALGGDPRRLAPARPGRGAACCPVRTILGRNAAEGGGADDPSARSARGVEDVGHRRGDRPWRRRSAPARRYGGRGRRSSSCHCPADAVFALVRHAGRTVGACDVAPCAASITCSGGRTPSSRASSPALG